MNLFCKTVTFYVVRFNVLAYVYTSTFTRFLSYHTHTYPHSITSFLPLEWINAATARDFFFHSNSFSGDLFVEAGAQNNDPRRR